jgi:hypothetical protein
VAAGDGEPLTGRLRVCVEIDQNTTGRVSSFRTIGIDAALNAPPRE